MNQTTVKFEATASFRLAWKNSEDHVSRLCFAASSLRPFLSDTQFFEVCMKYVHRFGAVSISIYLWALFSEHTVNFERTSVQVSGHVWTAFPQIIMSKICYTAAAVQCSKTHILLLCSYATLLLFNSFWICYAALLSSFHEICVQEPTKQTCVYLLDSLQTFRLSCRWLLYIDDEPVTETHHTSYCCCVFIFLILLHACLIFALTCAELRLWCCSLAATHSKTEDSRVYVRCDHIPND